MLNIGGVFWIAKELVGRVKGGRSHLSNDLLSLDVIRNVSL